VPGLAAPEAGEAQRLRGAGSVTRVSQIPPLDAESRVELHLRDKEELACGLAAFEVAVGIFGVG
jgi:hypothetical protein